MEEFIGDLEAIGFKVFTLGFDSEGKQVSYTKESATTLLERFNELNDAVTDAISAAEEYIAALDDDEDDEDSLGMAVQSLEDSVDALQSYGVQLEGILKEGSTE